MFLKIYLLERMDNVCYDEFNGCVVVAKDAEDAVTIAPCGHAFDPSDSTWCDISQIKCTEVGVAKKNQKRGVIMASFKAG